MYKKILLLVIVAGIFYSVDNAFAQEIQLATFQETAQILIDQQFSNNVTASISLQSTSSQEMQITPELENKILDDKRIIAVVITNEENCVLGVFDESCILINVKRDESWEGINEIQDETKKIGDLFIEDINDVFDTNAAYHSAFLHHRDETNVALETSGVISGRNTVSAVYTMPQEATDSMYGKLSALLLPKVIRDSGGFYATAENLSREDNAKMTFSIIPLDSTSLFQLKLSVDYPDEAGSITEIRPLEFLKTNKLERSNYFSQGFYPLNSLVQVIILGDNGILSTDPPAVQTEIKNDVAIPTDFKKAGWVIDASSESTKEAMYLFGDGFSVNSNEMKITLVSSLDDADPVPENSDESLIIVGIIIVGAIAAAIFFLKGYKKSPS